MAETTEPGDDDGEGGEGAAGTGGSQPMEVPAPQPVVDLVACAGELFEYRLEALAGTGDDTWDVSSGQLPPGIDLVDGVITGVPLARDSYDFSVRVSDGVTRAEFLVRVNTNCPVIADPSLPEACLGEVFKASLFVDDGSPPYNWELLEGSPTWLTIDGIDGRADLSGVAEEAGDLRVRVTDIRGVSDETTVSLGIKQCVHILGSEPTYACVDREYRHELLAEGGDPASHTWSLSGDIPGIALEGNLLAGVASSTGTFPVVLGVTNGEDSDSVVTAIEVRQCVQIPSQALPEGTVGEAYLARLTAFGDAPPFAWTSSNLPLGLGLSGSGELSGTPTQAGSATLTVRATDANGDESQAEVTLVIRDPLTILTRTLPDACPGQDYYARLEAHGAVGGYQWQSASVLPSGLTLGSDGVISGAIALGTSEAVQSVQVSVHVTSGSAPTVTRPLTLQLRPSCKFAFLQDDLGTDRIYLGSGSAPGSLSELSGGLLGAGEEVHSFKFAPDGRHLAFATGGVATVGLFVANVATEEVRSVLLDVPDLTSAATVEEFAWSKDASWLGVVIRDESSTRLFAAATSPSIGPTLADVTDGYVGGLFWVGSRVCYRGVSFDCFDEFFCIPSEFLRAVRCHDTDATGVLAESAAPIEVAAEDLDEALFLPGTDELLVLRSIAAQPFDPLFYSFAADEAATHTGEVMSPALQFSAKVETNLEDPPQTTLEVFTAGLDPNVDPLDSVRRPRHLASIPGCDEIHAWSQDGSWLACRSATSLQLVQLAPAGAVQRVLDLPEAITPSSEFRRLFTEDGRWYVYELDGDLFLVDLRDGAITLLDVPAGSEGSAYSGLESAGNGTSVMHHHGGRLDVVFLSRTAVSRRTLSGGISLPPSPSCSGDYLYRGPDYWCGGHGLPTYFSPAPDGRSALMRDADGRLWLSDALGASAPALISDGPIRCLRESTDPGCRSDIAWAP